MTGDEFLNNARRAGALVTGGPVQEGWGKLPFSRGTNAHYWTKVSEPDHAGAYLLRSACGMRGGATPRVPLLGHGNLPFCSRCEDRLMKEMT